MTTIGPSQEFKNLVTKSKQENGTEKSNIINQTEADDIKKMLLDEAGKCNTEESLVAFMDEAQKFLGSESGLNLTNVTFEITKVKDGTKSLLEPTQFSFEVKGKITGETTDVIKMNFGVTDYKTKATNDANNGKDPQFSVLANSGDTKNGTGGFLKYDEKGNIQGVFDGDKSYGGVKSIKKLADLPSGVPANIKDVIKADFVRYAEPGKELTTIFPMKGDGTFDPKVVDSFMKSLKSIPGNESNPNITEQGAKELLNYIHKGTNSDGKTDVKQLQCLLKNMTGKTGEKISDYNNPPSGDGQYGFATTLQVRELGAGISAIPVPTTTDVKSGGDVEIKDEMKTKEIKTWLVLGDRSQSMASKQDSFGKIFKDPNIFNKEAKYTIASFEEYQGAAIRGGKTRQVGPNGMNADDAEKSLDKDAGNFKTTSRKGGDMEESGLQAAIDMMSKPDFPVVPEKEKPAGIMIVTDALEQDVGEFENVVKLAKEKGYSQLSVALIGSEGVRGITEKRMITIDLTNDAQVNYVRDKMYGEAGITTDVNKATTVLNEAKDRLFESQRKLALNLSEKQELIKIKNPKNDLSTKEKELLENTLKEMEASPKGLGIREKISTDAKNNTARVSVRNADTKLKSEKYEKVGHENSSQRKSVSNNERVVREKEANLVTAKDAEGKNFDWRHLIGDPMIVTIPMTF